MAALSTKRGKVNHTLHVKVRQVDCVEIQCASFPYSSPAYLNHHPNASCGPCVPGWCEPAFGALVAAPGGGGVDWAGEAGTGAQILAHLNSVSVGGSQRGRMEVGDLLLALDAALEAAAAEAGGVGEGGDVPQPHLRALLAARVLHTCSPAIPFPIFPIWAQLIVGAAT